ncbi:MAG: hypothetical protein ACE5KW_03265 [Dehalococcoidia bacterium]
MATRKGRRTPIAPEAEAHSAVESLRRAVASGQNHWFPALLEAISTWRLPEETVGDRHYRYLIGGEAFDWLLLAERLCQGLDGLVPAEEREALLLTGRPPLAISEQEFRRQIGAVKYRAHLNYVYGVLVENALQMVVEEEIHKERLNCVWEKGRQVDEEVCLRIYGATRFQLLQTFRQERGLGRVSADELHLNDYREFTYWLFRHRLRHCDPARVASDTRKGLAALARLRTAARPSAWAEDM